METNDEQAHMRVRGANAVCIPIAGEQDYLIRELIPRCTASTNGHLEKPSRTVTSLETINVQQQRPHGTRPRLRPLEYGKVQIL